jgi:hypothetical protein
MGVMVFVAVRDGVGVGVKGVPVGETVGEGVGDIVGVRVGVPVLVTVNVGVGVTVCVFDGELEGPGVVVGAGVKVFSPGRSVRVLDAVGSGVGVMLALAIKV